MSASVMTSRRVFLDPQPGGVPPTLHLKPKTTGIRLYLFIKTQASDGTGFVTTSGKRAVLKGVRPDGQEVFLGGSTSYFNAGREAYVIISSISHLETLTAVPGTYVLELSIFDTSTAITKKNEGDYARLTTAKFYLSVDRNA